MSASKKSKEHWDAGYYCAESVLLAITELKGIKSDFIPKIATGFCSGLARTGGICGALSGAILGINLVFGRNSSDESVEPNYSMVQNIIRMFEEKFNSTKCIDLINCDLATEEGYKLYREKGLKTKCREIIGVTTGLVELLLEDNKD